MEAGTGAAPVTFCHRRSTIRPWTWSLDVRGHWRRQAVVGLTFFPQTKVKNDHSPILNVTCKIMSPSSCTPTPPESVKERGSGGQGIAGAITEQALHMPSTHAEPAPVTEQEVTSDDNFMMCQGQGVSSKPLEITSDNSFQKSQGPGVSSQPMPAAESTCSCFYIPHWMMKQPASLWPNDMINVERTPGLPSSPLINYSIMAIGWDSTNKAYHPSSITNNRSHIPTDRLASDVYQTYLATT